MPITTDGKSTLENILEGCRNGNSKSQELLYKQFYGFAMGVCVRYTRTREEAVEVLNDGFLKVFTNAGKIDLNKSFKSWLRRVMVNTALDYYRQHSKHYFHSDLQIAENLNTDTSGPIDEINHEQLVALIQNLSPAYRMVFNLFVIDGYSHDEIGEMLGISVGTSKSNLARARLNLREMLNKL
ncbi:RNA polymerase sigma-70 factor, ECF subfamily [Pseudarcicella hirudinis]|uniref:RNA polymerase sigma-70 factor, ECF subfamily n=1 Tax=Pseudarcicella hirudinis TaxID=1079859 RepID=A0A1I5WT59_9BACT|nr:sigma-70 family RNA polymerase sigma factor [Pseudarcicella hirudinis]SFQ22965.1 RNA polymerase sigma-70 factor, ECF subfamily [Pseudarcicella hirudinis]